MLLASQAAVAIENSRLYSERSAIARTLQKSLLPERLPEIPGYELAGAYLPALEGTEVGGDFYDFFETPQGWIVLLGDVTGRGVEAAAMTSLVRHGARFLAKDEHSPSRILRRLNQALREQPGLSLCSALCVRLERDQVIEVAAVERHLLQLDAVHSPRDAALLRLNQRCGRGHGHAFDDA